MEDTQKIQSEQDSLKIINQVAGKTQQPQTPKPTDNTASEEPNLMIDEVALPELTDDFNAKKKTRRSIPFQLVFLGTFIVGLLSLVRGCSTMSGSQQAQKSDNAVATTPMAEDERQELLGVINDQKLAIQGLQQGKRIDIRQGKDGKLPKTPVNSTKVSRLNSPSTRRTPPPAATTARSIPVRRLPMPRPASAKPKVVYKERVVYKEAPAKPVAAAPPSLKPVSRVSLTQKHEPVAQTQPQPIKIKRSPYKPIQVSTTPMPPTQPQRKPKLTSAESGVLVASNQMTGDLLKDMAPGSGSESGAEQPTSGRVTPSSTSLVSGTIPAGTKVKAAFTNSLTWVAGIDSSMVQPVHLRLKEDLGGFAKKGSVAIGEVISIEGDIAQVQIVSIDGKSIASPKSDDPRQTRPTPIAVVQYKDTPYLQAKAKNTSGPGFGDKLLRAGLNAGVDQLRGSGIGDRAGNVVTSLLPDQRNQFSQRGSSILAFESKDVEIYFLEGVE